MKDGLFVTRAMKQSFGDFESYAKATCANTLSCSECIFYNICDKLKEHLSIDDVIGSIVEMMHVPEEE